jgi:uncharacterized protein
MTNGRYLDSKTLDTLLKLKADRCQITIDGMCDIYCKSKGATPADFDNVIKNIAEACEKIKISIRFNIPNNDADEAAKITDYLFNELGLLGKVSIYFACVSDYSLDTDESQRLSNAYIDNYWRFVKHMVETYGLTKAKQCITMPKRIITSCGIIRMSNICIAPQGELYKCHHDLGDSSRIVGDIWTGRQYNELELSYYATSDDVAKSECSGCNYLPVCLGGCANNRITNCHRMSCVSKKQFMLKQKLFQGGILDETTTKC